MILDERLSGNVYLCRANVYLETVQPLLQGNPNQFSIETAAFMIHQVFELILRDILRTCACGTVVSDDIKELLSRVPKGAPYISEPVYSFLADEGWEITFWFSGVRATERFIFSPGIVYKANEIAAELLRHYSSVYLMEIVSSANHEGVRTMSFD